ncbi:MAG: hypothetical protein AAF799_23720 [Myxococcota bacterium]
MTAAVEQSWIESSLARLEELEARREQIAATAQPQELAELDEEIKGLYEALESVAGDEEGEAANEAAAPVAVAPAPVSEPVPAATPEPSMMPAPAANYDDDLDIKPPSSKLPLILGAVLLIGGGVGAFMFLGGDSKPEAPPQAAGPAKVIKASAVVEDTQEPVVAKGGDADRTAGTNYKQSSRPAASNGGSKRRSSSSSKKRGKKNDGRKVSFDGDSKDPLAGVE